MFPGSRDFEGSANMINMTNHDYCAKWRQVRIFSKRGIPAWYLDMLADIVRSAWLEFPTSPFFFSMYVDRPGGDEGDTNIDRLPAEFALQVPSPEGTQSRHCSLRLRFKANHDFEKKVVELVGSNPDYWYSDIHDFDIVADLGTRFASNAVREAGQADEKARRARIVAEALRANCIVVLDAIVGDPGQRAFEKNGEGGPWNSTFLIMAHMYNNVWKDRDGNGLPFGFRTLVGGWMI